MMTNHPILRALTLGKSMAQTDSLNHEDHDGMVPTPTAAEQLAQTNAFYENALY